MQCVNGHQFSAEKQSPRFCPVCGVGLTGQCPNGHEMAVGATVCAQCGALGGSADAATLVANPAVSVSGQKGEALPPLLEPPPALRVAPSGHLQPNVDRSRRGLVVALCVVGVLLVAGASVAVALALTHKTPNTNNQGQQTTQQPTNDAPPSQPTEPPTPIDTTPTLAPGLAPVDTSAVSSAPEAQDVALTLETYFGGIDGQNFPMAYTAYSPRYQSEVSEERFATTDATSDDTDVVLTGITPNPSNDSLLADITFTSSQAAADGPNGETCTQWTIEYTMVNAVGEAGSLAYVIDSATGSHVGCPGQP